ncbi:hypothetical protein CK203_107919 [Vitis vinifera]|uniref:Ubiquitin-like protease family profile domain-containing protein n=1 Tax=Vitis vinifera TaxID=29760 RepID=A0A438DCV8_VITVI|nr:hypothetical protein CK203_107919 [Vitis vinifera]
MKVVEKDERTSDHKDNDMRNVEDGDKQDAKVHEQQEEGHKVEEKSLMEERLSENDSCGDMELHVSPIVNNQCQDEKVNVDVPYVEKQEEQLSSLVVLPRQLKKTRSTMERKPSKFKVSPYIHQSNKMPKPKRFPSIVVGSQKIIPMSILPNVEDSHSLSTLESLVVAYVFDVSLDKSELLVNFQYEHANRADFLTLGPRQELLDVIINVFACKLNSFENKFKGIRPTRCYLPTTFAVYIHPDARYMSGSLVEECAHFFNLNGHLKNLSSVPIERPTWVDVQANGWDCGVHVINHMRRSDFMDSSSTLPIGTLQL